MSKELLVFKKLQEARVKLQKSDLKKSGHNKFAGYKYFETADFLPTINDIFLEMNLCHTFEFDSNIAVMSVIDVENGGVAKFSCPMSTAQLKGCHDVQNLGAAITYISRYLFVMSMAICEHDQVDSQEPSKNNYEIEKLKFLIKELNVKDEILKKWTDASGVDKIEQMNKEDVKKYIVFLESKKVQKAV